MQGTGRSDFDEDIFLWQLISRGDKKAFENLFSKYYAVLYSYCRYYVPDEDAEEIVLDLMTWLWEKRREFSPNGNIRQYLLRAVKNKCFTFIKKQNLELCSDDFFFAELNTFYETTDSFVINELEAAIDQAIDELPESYRKTFEMNRFQNKSRSEIALELGVSIKTIDYRMSQATNILKVKLKDYLPLIILLCRLS